MPGAKERKEVNLDVSQDPGKWALSRADSSYTHNTNPRWAFVD